MKVHTLYYKECRDLKITFVLESENPTWVTTNHINNHNPSSNYTNIKSLEHGRHFWKQLVEMGWSTK
jgi:hypothetical protein